MTDSALAQRIAQLEDSELVRMLTTHAQEYRPEALALAAPEAQRRGLSFSLSPEAGQSAAGAERETLEVSRYSAAGKQITCTHCGSALFYERQALLNTRLLTFFDFDWLNRSATALICASCSLIQWVASRPDRRTTTSPAAGDHSAG